MNSNNRQDEKERRGLRQFLLQVGVFSLFAIAALAVGEYLVRTVPNPYQSKHLRMTGATDDIATLILGNSVAYYGIRASEIDSCFNLANVSQNPDYDNLLLRKYIDRLPNLRRVIIPITYSTFVESPFEGSPEWWYAINYKVYMDIGRHSDFSRYNFELSHFSVYSGKLRNKLTGKEGLKFNSFGDGMDFAATGNDGELENLSEGNEAELEKSADIRVAINTAPDFRYLDFNREKIESTIRLCREHGVTPILISTPVIPRFLELADRKQLRLMKVETQRLQKEFGLPYCDYTSDPRFNSSDFHDADHLNPSGASKLTSFLKNEILTRR